MTTFLPLAALTLLVIGAWVDVRTRRIPDWVTAGIACAYGLFVIASPEPVPWATALLLAAICFLLGWLAFRFAVMGGGDVKLIAALMLWAGPEHGLAFVLVMSLAGGVLALFTLWYERIGYAVLAPLALVGHRIARRSPFGRAPEPKPEPEAPAGKRRADIPYAVAVAAGGALVLFRLAGL